MGISWPSQKAQPVGAKLKGKTRISATNGSAMRRLLGLRRKDAEQRDDEIDAEIGLEVLVRLVSPRRRNRARRKRGDRRWRSVGNQHLRLREQRSRGGPLAGEVGGAGERMRVQRNLLGGERDRFHSAVLSERVIVAARELSLVQGKP